MSEQQDREELIAVIRESPLVVGDAFRPSVRMVSPCGFYRLVERSPGLYVVERFTRFIDAAGDVTMIWSEPVAVPSCVSRLLGLVSTRCDVNARGEMTVIENPNGLCTVHDGDPDDPTDVCGWCGSKECLTEPRDFGYPPIGK